MGFRRSLVRIQSPRHCKARQNFKFWRASSFWQEIALQETRHFSASFWQSETELFLLATLLPP